ncbi:MAG: hypothetical protein QT03_C0001G1324 [archaeon GW2011_AR10]|uniref:Uncharacterized protein n=1 Tax=Candidatus Iainarchaeum sp. TaxID=3101447 RepID=A0A7J4IVT3_9ARCH|nr:MAG: hypothetical protein QT03_C0001G1324 [archaeon GW2011_AR10]HIH08884.1 hypothetical protein [Candidatus Diapherotrites archaeon]
MLLEILAHLATLDGAWVLAWPLRNPMMTFMFFSVIFIFMEGQNIIRGSIVIFATLFAFLDFEKVLGIPFFVGSFLLIYYISKLIVLAIAENNRYLRKYLIFINELQFYGAFIVSILFFR